MPWRDGRLGDDDGGRVVVLWAPEEEELVLIAELIRQSLPDLGTRLGGVAPQVALEEHTALQDSRGSIVRIDGTRYEP